MKKHAHGGHRERVKERALREGLDNFPPHNAMELLLFYGVPQGDTNDIAHALIDTFGSFESALDAPYDKLLEVPGVGPHTATLLKLMPQFCRYYLDRFDQPGTIVDTPAKMGDLFRFKYVGMENEAVYAAALDSKYKLIKVKKIAEGTINATALTVKMIADFAITSGTVYIVLSHNHPHGVALPSSEDITTTAMLRKALLGIGIRILDHIIVAENDYVSMAQSGQYASALEGR